MLKNLVKFLFGKRNWSEDQKAAVNDYIKLTIAWSMIFEVIYFVSFFAYVKKLEKNEKFYTKNKNFYEKLRNFFNLTWHKIKEAFSFAPDRTETESSDDDTEEE